MQSSVWNCPAMGMILIYSLDFRAKKAVELQCEVGLLCRSHDHRHPRLHLHGKFTRYFNRSILFTSVNQCKVCFH